MNRRPFDLAKLDFENIRLRRRKRLLLFSALPAGVVALVMIKMLSLPLLSNIAHGNYNKYQNDNAVSWLQPLTWLNWMESYKVYFNQGDAYFKSGKYDQAEEKFRRSLESVPAVKECDVRINLALSIEQQADRLLSDKKYDEAVLKYDDAKAVLYDGEDSCNVRFHNKSTGDGDQTSNRDQKDSKKGDDNNQDKNSSRNNSRDAQNIEKRVRDKSRHAKQSRNNDQTSQSNESNSSTQELKTTEQKLQKLEDNTNKAQKKRAERIQQNRNSVDYEKNRGQNDHEKKRW